MRPRELGGYGLVVAVCVGLTAPAARAQIDNSALPCGDGPTFYPRGDHWAVTPTTDPTSGATVPTPVTYQLQADGSTTPGLAGTGADAQAIHRAFDMWMLTTCDDPSAPSGKAYPNINVVDSGTPYPTRDRGDNADYTSVHNVIYFLTSTAGWPADSQTLALTTNIYPSDTGYVVTSDMEINNVNFQWRARKTITDSTGAPLFNSDGTIQTSSQSYGCSTTGANASTCYDVESVVIHEAGHFLGFNHVQCADAVMFPTGTPDQERNQLSEHEVAGLCTIYPPRPTNLTTARANWEACSSDSQCPGGLCIVPQGFSSRGWDYCTMPCTTTADCATGFVCDTSGTTSFCKPGVHDTGAAATGGSTGTPVANPTTGLPTDFCAACSTGSDCSDEMCVNDGSGTSICTVSCIPSSAGGTSSGGCPTGFDCLAAGTANVCWPQDPSNCSQSTTGVGLNDVCYEQGTNGAQDSYSPCAGGLICFGFKPRCAGQEGACVTYCDANNPCANNETCCYGVTSDGSCVTAPTASLQYGGCFDIRQLGQSCVTADHAVCAAGTTCLTFGQTNEAKCYQGCATGSCNSDTTCQQFSDNCSNSFSVCCATADLPNACSPGAGPQLRDVGVACDTNSQCSSGLCLHHDATAACSQSCNYVTGVGCPSANTDVNGDGTADGPFVCLRLTSGDDCWPQNGPVQPLNTTTAPPPPTGCCSAMGRPRSPADLALNALVWLPLVGAWWRRRRRPRRAS